MSKSNYERNRVLNARFGGGTYTKPATVYVALFLAAPNVAGGGTEVAGGSYARVAVTNDATNFPDAVAGVKSNAAAIAFPSATSAWGVITHGAVFDALTGGNLLDFAPFDSPQTIQSGGQFTIGVGQLVLTES
jgi:hypothetical protein